jgi:glycosyltransferase involved in cell wall biosynthesis
VTVAVLVCIPHFTGYFEQKFEIFKLSLASIFKHTDVAYDLLIFDNGSAPEVISYLLDLRAKGLIQYLILSRSNLGCLGAFNIIASAAPGRYLAYSDDDIVFRPNWLSAQLKIFESFPRVGMVSGLPTWQNFSLYAGGNLDVARSHPSMVVECGKGWPHEWAEEYCEGTGRDIHEFQRRCENIEVVKLSNGDISAYATCTHCQFLTSKEVVEAVLPVDTRGKTMYMDYLDERVNQKGFMRLSTLTPYVLHVGNRLSPSVARSVSTDKLQVHVPKAHRVSLPIPIAWMLKMPRGRALLHKLYAKTFEWLSADC